MVLTCTLDAAGNLKGLRVRETGPAEMTAKVVAALRSWKFQPAMRGDQPVEVTAILGFGIDTNDRNLETIGTRNDRNLETIETPNPPTLNSF